MNKTRREYSLFVRIRGQRYWHRASRAAMSRNCAAIHWQDIMLALMSTRFEPRIRPVDDGWLPEGSFVANEAEAWFNAACKGD